MAMNPIDFDCPLRVSAALLNLHRTEASPRQTSLDHEGRPPVSTGASPIPELRHVWQPSGGSFGCNIDPCGMSITHEELAKSAS